MSTDERKTNDRAPIPPAGRQDMAFPGAAWEETPATVQGIDAAGLEHALFHLARQTGRDGISEVVVVRNGRIIWKGSKAACRHNVWSCTKSFTSTILGLLIDREKCSLDTLAQEYLPDLSILYPAVRLRHFATMTSGYDGGGDQSETPFVPSAPLFAPGAKFQYWDSAMNQFLHVLTRIAGEPARELFQRSIAEPIGMRPEDWNWGDFGLVDGTLVNGGAGNKGTGIWISALDMARFGHLFLNRGNWDERQLISSEWVDLATGTQVPNSTPSLGREGQDGPGGYGFNWWTNGERTDGARRWPEAPPQTYAACGFNNNRCFVIPEWNMVVVRLGQDGKNGEGAYNAFFRMLGKSLADS